MSLCDIFCTQKLLFSQVFFVPLVYNVELWRVDFQSEKNGLNTRFEIVRVIRSCITWKHHWHSNWPSLALTIWFFVELWNWSFCAFNSPEADVSNLWIWDLKCNFKALLSCSILAHFFKCLSVAVSIFQPIQRNFDASFYVFARVLKNEKYFPCIDPIYPENLRKVPQFRRSFCF